MNGVQKISFPYFLDHNVSRMPESERWVIFFGADFHNLPIGTNQELFAKESNRILDFIRLNFPGRKLIYQAHPNETNEIESLDMSGFTIGERTVAEVLLFDSAPKIEYVFSVCSGASISAYAMGFDSAVFIDRLHGIIPEEAITGYRSYFGGLPEHFFIKDLDKPAVFRGSVSQKDEKSFDDIAKALGKTMGESDTAWFLASDPSTFLKALVLAREIKKRGVAKRVGFIKVQSKRWGAVEGRNDLWSAFDEIIALTNQGVRYSARPGKLVEAVKTALYLKRIPLSGTSVLVSFATMLFEENCILNYFPWQRRIGLIENRWYEFTFEDGHKVMDQKGFHNSWGTIAFNFFIEPILRLHRTIYLEYKDGKVINYFRYRKPLSKIYDKTYVLMPSEIKK